MTHLYTANIIICRYVLYKENKKQNKNYNKKPPVGFELDQWSMVYTILPRQRLPS